MFVGIEDPGLRIRYPSQQGSPIRLFTFGSLGRWLGSSRLWTVVSKRLRPDLATNPPYQGYNKTELGRLFPEIGSFVGVLGCHAYTYFDNGQLRHVLGIYH